jgi:hypothetical protein
MADRRQPAVRAGRKTPLPAVLDGMVPTDREGPAPRHFEAQTNGESAELLGLSKAAANNRDVPASGRPRDQLGRVPGFHGER